MAYEGYEFKHCWNQEGTRHWLESGKKKGTPVGYTQPAILKLRKRVFCVVTDYYSGSSEFPNTTNVYEISIAGKVAA